MRERKSGRIVVASVLVLLAVATAQAQVLATQDFEDLTVGTLKGQLGGTGWKLDDVWYSTSQYPPTYANVKDWIVEQDPTSGNHYIRAIGLAVPTAFRTFCPKGTVDNNTLLTVRADLAIDGPTLAANLNFRVFSAESSSANPDRRVDVVFNVDGTINFFAGAVGTMIARWDGADGYADARNRTFQTFELVLDTSNTTLKSAKWGGADLPLAPGLLWRSTGSIDLTDINMIGGNNGSGDPALLPGGVMVDNFHIEKSYIVPPFVCNTPFADADGDLDVDMLDFAAFQLCPRVVGPSLSDTCKCFDRDSSGAVDGADFLEFGKCATGPSIPWSAELAPDCAP